MSISAVAATINMDAVVHSAIFFSVCRRGCNAGVSGVCAYLAG